MTSLVDSIYLSPRDAIQSIAGKNEVITWDWRELSNYMSSNAFTVAKMTKIDLLKDVKNALKSAIKQGLSGPEFNSFLESRLRASGWWGKQTTINLKTGVTETVTLGTPYRIDNIFRTNSQQAFMSGKWRRFYDNQKARPFLEYVPILDGSTRETHAALKGFIAPIASREWRVIFPPNGFNCRCRVRALTAKQARARSKEVIIPSEFPDTGFEGNPGINSDVKLVSLLRTKAVNSKNSLAFKQFISSPERKSFLIDTIIPSIVATGSIAALNVLRTPSGEDVMLKLNKKFKNPGELVDSVASLSPKAYIDTKTGEIYILKKGTNRKYYIFSSKGLYKKTRTVLFFSKRFKKL